MSAETKDRMARKQNIIIAGLKLTANTSEGMKRSIEEFFRNELEITTRVLEITETKDHAYLVKVASFEHKLAIFRRIYRLVEKRIQVQLHPDLTPREQQIQDKIASIAMLERAKGNRVKVGYCKLIINHKLHVWDEETGRIVPVINPDTFETPETLIKRSVCRKSKTNRSTWAGCTR